MLDELQRRSAKGKHCSANGVHHSPSFCVALSDYSEMPRCSLAVAVSLPKSPSLSSLGPAVKKSSVANPDLPASEPKLRAQRPGMTIGVPFVLSNMPTCLPLTALKARILPLPKLPISKRWLNGPKSLGARAMPQGAFMNG